MVFFYFLFSFWPLELYFQEDDIILGAQSLANLLYLTDFSAQIFRNSFLLIFLNRFVIFQGLLFICVLCNLVSFQFTFSNCFQTLKVFCFLKLIHKINFMVKLLHESGLVFLQLFSLFSEKLKFENCYFQLFDFEFVAKEYN